MAPTAAELYGKDNYSLDLAKRRNSGYVRSSALPARTNAAPVVRPPTQAKTVGNDLNVLPGSINIQVTEADIRGDCGASFPANAVCSKGRPLARRTPDCGQAVR